jgi:alpha-amylase/alpha-mannosidase (GH57 family)
MMRPNICIHGHFYQPSRENPWLEAIEIQDSAHPYHDWNARISAECYAPNAAARLRDDEGLIHKITNNYARMSFNFGPTLLSWLERSRPGVYAAVRDADARSRKRFSGHGSALAQAYNHMILPLATAADRNTQILWGIRDFRHRFGRPPEGMWLPETAVDLATLANMAQHGIRFTILSPHQARRVRPLDGDGWCDVGDGSIDTRQPYLQRLANGDPMAIFFYDGALSKEVAFGDLLRDGDAFVSRLVEAAGEDNDEARLIHFAIDGETFGHHRRRGDLALAHALEAIDAGESADLTNYGEYLHHHPPEWEVEIKENTAWSCPHGLERWRSDCGCDSGQRPEWHQRWRAPLREALDWLRDTLAATFMQAGSGIFADPHQARDDYIDVILDRRPATIDRFLGPRLAAALNRSTRVQALKLLESQRQAQLMYTSCAWFFDDLSGIETVQVLQHAGRALQLTQEMSGTDIKTPFLGKLALAKSNIPRDRDGRRLFQKWVRPSSVDLRKVAAHYAISALFEEYSQKVPLFCYWIENRERRDAAAGNAKIAVGRARITSRITWESEPFCYAALHLGDHAISCGVGRLKEAPFESMAARVLDKFEKGDTAGVIQDVGDAFGSDLFSLSSLFRDEKRKVLGTIAETATSAALSAYRQLYENHAALMRFIHASGGRIPRALYAAGEIVIHNDLKQALQRRALDSAAIRGLVEEADRAGIVLEADTLAFIARDRLNRLVRDLEGRPASADRLALLAEGVALCRELPFTVAIQEVQNLHYRLHQTTYPGLRARAETGDAAANRWVTAFRRLAKMLHMRMR